MEDNSSTSEEYEIIDTVPGSPNPVAEIKKEEEEPKLKIANNGNYEDLQNQLSEVRPQILIIFHITQNV